LERLLLYLDDLDDLFGVLGLIAERLRRFARNLARILVLLSIAAGGMLAALREPPLGMAVVILLLVFLLYRNVTQPRFASRGRRATA
jgi:hypothetical protein